MLVQVNFRFPDGDELRYLERAPRRGSVVHHDSAEWVVTDVDLDTTGGYTLGLRRKRPASGRRSEAETPRHGPS
jgi:hypothetical protein